MIRDYFLLAIKNLKKRRLRSWLTMMGIFISIATVFVLISLSLGLQTAIKDQFAQLGTDKFFIYPTALMLAGPGTAAQDTSMFTTKDADIVEKVQGVKELSYFALENAEIKFKDKKKYVMAVGIPEKNSGIFDNIDTYKPEEGVFNLKTLQGKIVLGNAYKTGGVFGEEVKVGDKVYINGHELKVQGILKSLGNPNDDKQVYLELSDLKSIFNTSDRIDEIFVQIGEGYNINDVADRTEKALLKSRGLKEKTKDFTISTPEELLASFGTVLNIITGFLIGVALISLLVGAIGIANTMYASTLERTKEIGAMKAIGAKNSDILLIFLIESGLLGLIGGIVGVILGLSISKIIEFIAANQLGVGLLKAAAPLYLILGCLFFAFIIGAVSGIWPAYRASKLNTVDALRYE